VTVSWRLLRQVALTLLESPLTEARLRSSINRSYYAAYGEAKAFASRHGYTWNGKGGSHVQVWNFLRAGKGAASLWETAAWKAIGDAGIALKATRTAADYEDAPPPDNA
jgi:hypothetical protein